MKNDNTKLVTTKKKLMFVKGEDFYFLTYNILIILFHLNCFIGKRVFKDYRKLSFLVDFVSDPNLINILKNKRSNKILNYVDRELLGRAYSNSMIRQNQLIRLLFTLEQKKILILEMDQKTNLLGISLDKNTLPKKLFKNDLFSSESNNLTFLQNHVKGISNLTLDTMLQRLFDTYGIRRWV